MSGAPLPTLRGGRDGSQEHLEQVLRECVGNLLDGRPEVCITNLTHAVQLALGLDDYGPGAVPDSVRVLLEVIVARGGGFR